MKRHTNPLDHVSVAAPCPADWERMNGNEQVRFCTECNLNVYNLSGMTRADAERLIYQTEGRLCIRYYRKADGTILTKNCPVGLRALKQRLTRMASAVAAVVLSFFAGIFAFLGLTKTATAPEQRYTTGVMAVNTTVKQSETREVKGELAMPIAGQMVLVDRTYKAYEGGKKAHTRR